MIPIPFNLIVKDGKFIFDAQTCIYAPDELTSIVEYFSDIISPATGFKPKRTTNKDETNRIILELDSSLAYLNSEGYELIVTPDFVHLRSPNPAGIFYGIQTFRQLLPVEIESKDLVDGISWEIPCVHVEDYPRFMWRGFMFDVGRHFHGVEVIKRSLDLMALMKMNIFHWHLTDDQGWRVEIKKYPKLTEVGSKRKDTKIGGWLSKKYRGEKHEGYYTQEEIRAVVQYAEERFITVIPEIEMPGHSSAAIASYPKLSCRKEPIEIPTKFGIFPDLYCAGSETTFEFLQEVLDEIMDLFPSKIIHIGGDEAPKKYWKGCSDCQTRIKNENLKDEEDLQRYFTNRIASYLDSHGRKTMGWNEILGEKLDRNIITQWWTPDKLGWKKKVLAHIREGGKVVNSKFLRVYLDYNYIVTPLEKTYMFDPIPKELEPEFHEQILGVEAPIWTEWIPNQERLDWQVFPRLSAVAEICWSLKENKNYHSFIERLRKCSKRLDILGVKYASLDEVNPNKWYRFWNKRKAFRWPKI